MDIDTFGCALITVCYLIKSIKLIEQVFELGQDLATSFPRSRIVTKVIINNLISSHRWCMMSYEYMQGDHGMWSHVAWINNHTYCSFQKNLKPGKTVYHPIKYITLKKQLSTQNYILPMEHPRNFHQSLAKSVTCIKERLEIS